MPVACHPNIWWDWCMSEDQKEEIDPMFIKEWKKCVSVVYKMEVLGHFYTWYSSKLFDLCTFVPKYIFENI